MLASCRRVQVDLQLAGEVVVDGAGRDACRRGDLAHRRGVVALAQEEVLRCGQDSSLGVTAFNVTAGHGLLRYE